jgi:hypothetical protein
MTALGKFFLFFSSWFPAYAMVGLIAWEKNRGIAIGSLGLTVLSVLVYFVMERIIFSRAPRSLQVAEINRRDENLLMYVIAYLPPFFALDTSNYGQLAALVLFYTIFSVTYVNLNLYYLNPMFIFRSYRTYIVKAQSGEEYIALIRGKEKPEVGATIQYRGRDNILVVDNS